MNLSIEAISFDCHNAATLAAFWAEVVQRPVDPEAKEFFASVGRSGDSPLTPALMFLQVPEGRSGKNRVHLDLAAADYAAEVERLIKAGASLVAEFDEYGTVWTTLTDPEGNVFDVADASHG